MTSPTTSTVVPLPSGPFVEVTGVTQQGDTYAIAFVAHEFSPEIAPGTRHIHFFSNTTPAATAGTNGVPAPGDWLVYDGSSPAIDAFFLTSRRPAEATAICSLVADEHHAIADVDGDSSPDPDTGSCQPLP